MDSSLQILRLLGLVAKLLDNLLIIIWELTFEYFVDVISIGVVGAWILRLKAYFDYITWELKLAESDEVFGDLLDDALVLQGILELQHVLDKVVTVWIFNQVLDVINDIVGQLKLLVPCALLEASLHNTATMFMLSNLNAVVHASIEDELCVLRCEVTSFKIRVSWPVWSLKDHEEWLDYMVSMHVHCELYDILVKCLDDLNQSLVVNTFIYKTCILLVNYS